MPAGQSELGIFNVAMMELGESLLTDVTTPSKRQAQCVARYNDSRQAVIRNHPWNCTMKYVVLPLSGTQPPFGWSAAYDLPIDFLRMNSIEDDLEAKWKIVGNQLFSDQDGTLNLIYHWDLQDLTRFDALTARCIGYDLAYEIAPNFISDVNKLTRLQQKLNRKIEDAQTVDSQENSPKEWDDDVLLRSRR